MEALLLLTALVAFTGIFVVPWLRRRRASQALERLAGPAGPPGGTGPDGISFSKDASATPGGLVPVDQLDIRLPGPDPELVAALEEVQRTQDWRPAGRLLALTDESELRWQRVQSLAGAAAHELARWRAAGAGAGAGAAEAGVTDAGWLRRWRADEPADAGGAQVYAQFLVWQAMADPGATEHRIILEEARTVCGEATRLAPEDPIPDITELFITRGLSYRRADFDALWERITGRDRQHMGAHLAALPYLSEKWHGSRAEADAFARAAAADAPAGSLLPALPLFALYDHLPDVQLSAGMYEGAVIGDAIEAAQFAVLNARPGHPVEPHVRHLLLCFLVRAHRFTEAAEQVRVIDGYVGAIPWVDSENPTRDYAAYRALAIAGQ